MIREGRIGIQNELEDGTKPLRQVPGVEGELVADTGSVETHERKSVNSLLQEVIDSLKKNAYSETDALAVVLEQMNEQQQRVLFEELAEALDGAGFGVLEAYDNVAAIRALLERYLTEPNKQKRLEYLREIESIKYGE
jgi:hypothetical protein